MTYLFFLFAKSIRELLAILLNLKRNIDFMTSTIKYVSNELNENKEQYHNANNQEDFNKLINESIKSKETFNKELQVLINNLKLNNRCNNNTSIKSIDYITIYNNNKLTKYLITSGFLIGVSYFIFKYY